MPDQDEVRLALLREMDERDEELRERIDRLDEQAGRDLRSEEEKRDA
jgi:hypothetical protein